MSGFREELSWSIHPPVEIDQPYADADALAAAVRAKAAADGVPFAKSDVLVVIQDWAAAAGGQFGLDGQFAAAHLSPSLLCHELGHFYQRRNNQPDGHASTFNGHVALDYADPTCIMGPIGTLAAQESDLAHGQTGHDLTGPAMCPAATVPIGWLDRDHPTATVAVPRQPSASIQLARWAGVPAEGYPGAPVVAVAHSVSPGGADVYISLRSPRLWDRGFRTLAAQSMQRQIVAQELARSGATFLLAQLPVQPGASARLGRAPLRIDVRGGGDTVAEIDVVPDPWRLWSVLESPPVHRAARIAAVARGGDIDLFVIGLDGAVLQARFTGGVWLPWQALTDPHVFDPRAGIAAASSTPNTIDVFVVGRDDHLVRRRRSIGDQWAPDWQVLIGGQLSERSSLAATATAPGRVELFAGDVDGTVTHTTVTDDASMWNLLPALPRAGSLAAVTLSGHTVQVSAVTEGPGDGRIWTIAGQPNQWPTPWEPHPDVGLAEDGGIAAAQSTPGVSELVAAATPLAARSYAYGAWTGQPIRVPGQPPATNNRTVAAVFRSATVLDVFAVADGKIHRITRSFDPEVVQTDAQVRTRYQARIVASGGRFVRVSDDPLTRGLLLADEYLPTPATVFTIDELAYYTSWGDRTVVSIQAHDGRYVMALDGGGEWLRVGAATLGPWEKFVLTTSADTSTLMALGGHYWSAQGGDSWLLCDRVAVGPWETFAIARL
ncbi:hypothetical protein [Nocardia fluminea]|uniref:hypothetical protein n=1 Tax=Nocardia fluminea TaxID=134984 RepID=UPI0033F164EF